MQIRLDTKLEILDYRRTKASICLDFGSGGFTLSPIFILKNSDGKENPWKIAFPLTQVNGRKKPVIIWQGPMKAAIAAALSADHQALRASGEKRLARSRYYQNSFGHLVPEGQGRACKPGTDMAGGGSV